MHRLHTNKLHRFDWEKEVFNGNIWNYIWNYAKLNKIRFYNIIYKNAFKQFEKKKKRERADGKWNQTHLF